VQSTVNGKSLTIAISRISGVVFEWYGLVVGASGQKIRLEFSSA